MKIKQGKTESCVKLLVPLVAALMLALSGVASSARGEEASLARSIVGRRASATLIELNQPRWGWHLVQSSVEGGRVAAGVHLRYRYPEGPAYAEPVVGLSLWSHRTSRQGTQWQFRLGYKVVWRWAFMGLEHWSNGGALTNAPPPNGGEDWFLVGFKVSL